jgi:ligand-binding sensor domain-containing protein
MKTKILSGIIIRTTFLMLFTLNVSAQNPQWMNFTNGDAVNDIARLGNTLWIATMGGLVEYDKTTGQSVFYNKANSGLPANEVIALDVESNGVLWVITDAALSMYDGNSWATYNTSNGLPDPYVHDVAIDQSGTKWIASSSGVFSFDGSAWTVYDTSNSNITSQSASRIFISPSGEIWIPTTAGMEVFDGANWILYDFTVAPFSFYNTTDLAFRGNEVFVATHGGFSQGEGLAKFDGNTWFGYTPLNSGLPFDRVECMDLDTAGDLWLGNYDNFGLQSALVKFDGTTWTVDSTSLPQYLNRLLIDESNRFFAGIPSYGFYEFNGATFSKINTSNSGLNEGGGNELSIDSQHEIRATNYLGYTHFDRQVWSSYDTTNSSFLNSAVNGIVHDNAGKTWIATSEGVVQYNGSSWLRWDTSNSQITNQYVHAIAVDPGQAAWIGTPAGPFGYDGSVWTNFFSNAGSHIQEVFVSHDGHIWFASPGYGLTRFDGLNTWTNYIPPNGGSCTSGALDLNGNVWFGGAYLHKWNGVSWSLFTTGDGLPWDYITALAVDSNNVLWIGTQNGLSSYDGVVFTNYFVQSSPLTANYISDIEVDDFNNKWIGTSAGISVFNETGVLLKAEDPWLENETAPEIRFYPNPGRGIVQVDFRNGLTNRLSGITILTITDVLGNSLLEMKNITNSTKIDVSGLSPGIYSGKLTSPGGLISIGKFIVL